MDELRYLGNHTSSIAKDTSVVVMRSSILDFIIYHVPNLKASYKYSSGSIQLRSTPK